LHNKLSTTFVYVTHDQTEAMTMADRIVVMKDGEIHQVGTPQELYNLPCNIFVAGFIGTPQMNFIDDMLIKNDFGYCVKVDEAIFPISEEKFNSEILSNYIDKNIVIGIRAEDVLMVEDDSSTAKL